MAGTAAGAGGPAPEGPYGPVLRVTSGLAAGSSVPLAPGTWTIGRNSQSPWNFGGDNAISRRHATVEVSESGLVSISDLGSTYGTKVNGLQTDGAVKVRPGDVVTVGSTSMELTNYSTGERPLGGTGPGGYQTPWVGDVEVGVRKFLRFYFKLALTIFAIVLLLMGAVILVAYLHSNRTVQVPSVVGLDNVAAFQVMGQAGLTDLSVSQASTSVAFGQVIGTNPAAGTSVKAGTDVQVAISCGPPSPGVCP